MKIENFSNYEIYPNEGKIWSYFSNKFLKEKISKNGYHSVTLISDDNKKTSLLVHRVVWIAVNGEIPKGMQVNHIDEDKSNNCIDNLNLMTPKENTNWGTGIERCRMKNIGKLRSEEQKEKLSKALKGNHNNPQKSVGAYKDGELVMIFKSIKEVKTQGFADSAVCKCCKNCFNRIGNNVYKGFQWQYI